MWELLRNFDYLTKNDFFCGFVLIWIEITYNNSTTYSKSHPNFLQHFEKLLYFKWFSGNFDENSKWIILQLDTIPFYL